MRLMLVLLLAQAALAGTPCEEVVCVEVEAKANDAVTFYATSRGDGATIVFSVSAINMKPASPPILTRALRRGRTELITLTAIPGKKPDFSHAYFWEWGTAGATHDDRVSYRLPVRVGQAIPTRPGPQRFIQPRRKFALDFYLPRGTPVCAARGGIVAEVIDRFDDGGTTDPKFFMMANKVLILHEDGTIGAYLHLLRGGMRVKPGERVEAGTVIGLSGNSGWSAGPHLHFEVFRTTESLRTETLPVKFLTADGQGIVLEEGKWYRAE